MTCCDKLYRSRGKGVKLIREPVCSVPGSLSAYLVSSPQDAERGITLIAALLWETNREHAPLIRLSACGVIKKRSRYS